MAQVPLLELRGVSKNFGAVEALKNVNLTVNPAEIVALVGDNGSGKSTLIKSVAGIHQINGGVILWKGEPVVMHSPRDSAELGIEVVYQDLALADNLDVVENMFLGREDVSKVGRLDHNGMECRALEVLDQLAVTTIRSVRQPVASLSGGQRQSVAVSKAVMWSAELVILDEPTAALGVEQTRNVLDLVRRLGDQGLGVLLISHNLHDVFEVADRIVAIRLGQNVAEFDRRTTTQTEVVEAITFGRVSSVPGQGEWATS
jgi:D-xylose transport system ATP-binding protein